MLGGSSKDAEFSVQYQIEASGAQSQGTAMLAPGGKKKAGQGMTIALAAAAK